MKERKGLFSISLKVIENNPELAIKVLANVIVVRAECNYLKGTIEYCALSNMFRTISEAEIIPTYQIEIKENEINFKEM